MTVTQINGLDGYPEAKLEVTLSMEDVAVAALRHIYPVIKDFQLYWASDEKAYQETLMPLLSVIITEAEK